MMLSIIPSEEQPGSKAKKSWKSLYDERMASLRTEGLSSSYDHPEITHPDVNFTPCPRNDMSRKASSTSPTRPMSDGITMGASSTFEKVDDVDGQAKGRRVIKYETATAVDLIFSGASHAGGELSTGKQELNTYADTMTSLEKRLDAKSDLLMQKLDEILNVSRREERYNPREHSSQANDGDGAGGYASAQQSSRTNYESRNRERPRAAPSSSSWTNPAPPEADATPETRLPTVPQVRSLPDLITVSQDPTMYASMFEPLNRSLEASSPSSQSQPREERGQEGH